MIGIHSEFKKKEKRYFRDFWAEFALDADYIYKLSSSDFLILKLFHIE